MQPLKVLVLESDRGAAADAIMKLEAAGHNVVRCHDDGAHTFPCNALREDANCPLRGQFVDVVVTVRDRPLLQPAPTEDGVSCALQRHIPLVVAGDATMNPYEEYATATVSGDDVVSAAEDAAAAPLPLHSQVATEAVAEVAGRRGMPASSPVTVYRRAGRLYAVVAADDIDESARPMASVRITSALRTIDFDSTGIDVTFV
jgi:hypothetical protein